MFLYNYYDRLQLRRYTMGIKESWVRFKENLQPVAESFARRYDGKPERKVSINLENVKSLDDYVNEYAKLLREKENEANKSLSFRDVVSIYDELLTTCMADKKCLVERMTANFLSKTVRWSYERVWGGLFAGLYIISKKYDISYLWILEDVVQIHYEISFKDFSMIDDAAKFYNYDLVFVHKEIEEIWKKHFNRLFLNSFGEGIDMLKKADNEWNHGWGNYLHDRIREFDVKEASKWKFDYSCVKKLTENYPELTALAYRYLILTYLYDREDYGDQEDEDTASEFNYWLRVYFQRIMDYSENLSMEFEFKKYWRTILKHVFALADGVTLTVAIEALNKAGHISIEEMEQYVKCQAFYFIHGSSEATYNGNKLVFESDYYVEEMLLRERLMVIHRQLSNLAVFEVVSTENYAIIEMFYSL